MKLETLVQSFKVVQKVFDSIEDPETKWDYLPAYSEIKKAVKFYDDENEKIFKKYENGKSEIPAEKINPFNTERKKLLEVDIALKNKIVFTKKECEKAGLVISELEILKESNFLKL